MSEITIDKNIPVIPKSKYPFLDMEIGDSFFINKINTRSTYQGLYSSARNVGMRVSIRKAEFNGTKGFRVWRVE